MGVLEGKTARGHVCRPHAYCGALGTAPRRTGAKATMLRIETFAPARRCTAPSTSSLRRWTTREDLLLRRDRDDLGERDMPAPRRPGGLVVDGPLVDPALQQRVDLGD